MPLVRYVGGHDAVDIPYLGITVERDATVDIDDEGAAISLCRQPDNWQPVGWELHADDDGAETVVPLGKSKSTKSDPKPADADAPDAPKES